MTTLSGNLGWRAGPISPTGRIEAIDALRGIALLGVMAINVVNEFRVSIFNQFLEMARPASVVDRTIETILTLTVEMKAFALFSLLFGVGLAIQFERLTANIHRLHLLMRRLIVLFAIGLVHILLIWNGDILTEYALAGLLILPFLYGPNWLLFAGAILLLGFYLILPSLWPNGFPSLSTMASDIAEANRTYGAGSFSDILVPGS